MRTHSATAATWGQLVVDQQNRTQRSSELVVGYESHNYNGERNTYAPVPGARFVKMRRVPFEQIPGSEQLGLHRVFAPVPPNPNVGLVHLWNRVSVGRTPWGVSFEDTLPLLNPRIHGRAIQLQKRRLFSDNCRFIVGMSNFAIRTFQQTLSEAEWSIISEKLHMVYPHHPKSQRNTRYPALEPDGPLRLIFVGRDFFRKGGESALRAVEQVGDHVNLHLTVISRVEGNDYRGTPPEEVDVIDVRRRLMDNPRINWIQHLRHDEVMALIEQHHIGLLPTLSDTFGYSVLEFMSLGVPSVVTNVQALPEFTGDDTGWQLKIPTDHRGEWLGRDQDAELRRSHYFDSVRTMTQDLVGVLSSIRATPEVLATKSASSERRFDTQFDLGLRQETMLSLYSKAVEARS